ncbi:MAG: LysR family transcriptional regulator [Lachnospiraceae bacterium]|nr:LysR family transcriptional regulator [Lachnospiraceae bacterium]
MKIEDLMCFRSISQFSSFTKAAKSMFITQSNLSKRVKILEEELGGELFIRKANSEVVRTPFGIYISSYIENILQDYDMLLNAADDFKINKLKDFHLATFLNIAHTGFLKPITAYENTHENFIIETMERSHVNIKHALLLHEVDMAIAYKEFIGSIPMYEAAVLGQDPLVLVTTREYAERKEWGAEISIRDLQNEMFCFPREDLDLFKFYIDTCKNNGFIPQLTHSDVRLGTIRVYISAKMRCTLMPRSISASKFYEDVFKIISLYDGPSLTLTLYTESSDRRKTHKAQLKNAVVQYAEMLDARRA